MEPLQPARPGLILTERATDPPSKSSTSRGHAFEYPPSADDWEQIKDRIHQMYVIQKQPLKDVRKSLDRLGFRATDRMIKSRLRTWGFVKNAKKDDWGLLAVLHHRRKLGGRPSTIFEIHGQRKTLRDLHRFIRNQAKSPEEFLADHLSQWRQTDLPDYIRAWTPEPDDIRPNSPQSVVESPTNIQSPLPAKSNFYAEGALDTQMLARPLTVDPYARLMSPDSSFCTDPNFISSSDAIKAGTVTIMTNENSFRVQPEPLQIPTPTSPHSDQQCWVMEDELEACGTQLIKPQPLVSRIGRKDLQFWSWLSSRHDEATLEIDGSDDFHVCTRCRQPAFQHFRSIDNFEPVSERLNRNLLNDSQEKSWHLPVSTREEGPWLWISRCFLACMCFTRGDQSLGAAALRDAETHLERLLQKNDELILTSALLTITILHMHDQAGIASTIMKSAKQVVDRFIPDANDPIRITMTYFMHAADVSFQQSNITSDSMYDVYMRLKARYGGDHPYVITAQCNYSWLLKYEDKLEAAERNLWEVYSLSCARFTENHMQSIIALSLLAGCLSPQHHRRTECIELYSQVIAKTEDVLGSSHPYRLEAKRRLADKLKSEPGREQDVLQLHKEVLWGRAKMLGRTHFFTGGAHEQYAKDLRKLNRWEFRGSPTPEQLELADLFSRDPADAWTNASADGDHTMSSEAAPEMDDEKRRIKFKMSSSRTPSPASSDDYAAY